MATTAFLSPSSVLAISYHKENLLHKCKTQGIDNNNKSHVFIKFTHKKEKAVANALSASSGVFCYGSNLVGTLNTFTISVPTAALNGLSRNLSIVFFKNDPICRVIPIVRSPQLYAVPIADMELSLGTIND
jgi:hypothetical protein